MFLPPRCPNTSCPMHKEPVAGFFRKQGYYKAKCRPRPIPRFQCKVCARGFSRQTFRMDYRDHKPDLNPRLFELLASGVGLRQSSRMLRLSLRCTELKFRKVARHLRGLNRNLCSNLPPNASLQLDELETYEARRTSRPVTVPIVIEEDSRFIIATRPAPIRASGPMTRTRLRAIQQDEARFGKRQTRSRSAVYAVLKRTARVAERMPEVRLRSDEKTTYPSIANRVFGAERVTHQTTSSRLARGTWNPLFPINHTEAMARDLTGRLRRDSWLASKHRWFLSRQLEVFAAFRNLVRTRFNRDRATPAQMLGFTSRPLRVTELLTWRQDWRANSLHPLARSAIRRRRRVPVSPVNRRHRASTPNPVSP